MPSENFVKDVAEGITKAVLEFSSEKINSFVKKLKEGKLAFIQEKKTIELVKELYNSGELKFYKEYIEDKELLFLVKIGLTLRKLEEDKDRLNNLQDKIFHKFKVRGLHIAQFVQNGILNRFIGILIDNLSSMDDFKRDVVEVLENIEKHVLFVKGIDQPRLIIQKSIMIINSHSPSVFILSGIDSASRIVRDCAERLESLLENYELEKLSSGRKEILFFKRVLKK